MTDELKKPERKPDITLSDGRTFFVDLHAVTRREYLGMLRSAEDDETSDATIAKMTGIPVEDLDNLPQDDWLRIIKAVIKKRSEPLADPT
jgi:hypothetical protein